GAVTPGGQQVAERALPARAQGGDLHGSAQLVLVPAGQVEQRIGVGHAQRVRAGPGLDDLIAGLDLPLGYDPHVEPGPVMADQRGWPSGLAQPQAHPVAGHPRLGDLELGLADAVPVADAHLVVRETVNGEVLPELAVAEVIPAEVSLPVLVRLDL